MPTPVREEIVSRIATRIEAVATGLGYAFERNRFVPIEEGEVPALVLFDGGEEVVDGDSGGLSRELGLEVEAFVTAATGALLGAAVAEVAARIRLAMRPDAAGLTVDGFAWDVKELAMTTPEIGRHAKARAFAAFTLEYVVVYQTAEFDPYAMS